MRRTDMRRRSPTRRVLKWVGLVGCVTILAVAIVSLWRDFGYGHVGRHLHTGTDQACFWLTNVDIGTGCVTIT